MEFELLDKVVYEFVNFNKPYDTVQMSGGSGSPSYIPNDKIIGVIKEIKTITSKGYNFEYQFDEDGGWYEYTTIQYYITGYDKALNDYQLKKI